MALTVKQQDLDVNSLVAYKTTQIEENKFLLEIYETNENLKRSDYVQMYELSNGLSEEEFHKSLREKSKDLVIKRLSTNPEWN